MADRDHDNLVVLALDLHERGSDHDVAAEELRRAAFSVAALVGAYRQAMAVTSMRPHDRRARGVAELLAHAVRLARREWRESARLVELPPWLARPEEDIAEVVDLRESTLLQRLLDHPDESDALDIDSLHAELDRLRTSSDPDQPRRRWRRR